MTPLAVFLHAFGARYDLPLSLSLYIFSAAAVVVVSFVLVVIFAGGKVGETAVMYPRLEVRWLRGLPRIWWPRAMAGAVGVLLLLAVMVTGWFGPANPVSNPAEYLTWIFFWAGLVLLTGLVGPIWDAINPFRALDSAIRWIRRAPAQDLSRPDPLARAGLWPAIVLYFSWVCLELTSGYANRPWLVAWVALGYTVFTVAGMQVFGAATWLEHCEFFTVLFSILRRFAPIQVDGDRIYLRWWGSGLLDPWPAGWDRVVFVIMMLSSLAFDGLIATPLWQNITVDLEPLWQPLGQWGFFAIRTFGFLDLTLIFLAVFLAVMRLVMYFGVVRVDARLTSTLFVLTLVPIAFVYNMAHNWSYMFLQSQAIIPLLADPLGRGWHLLPTQNYQASYVLAQASTVWYAQVVLIVLGHIIAVFLSHLRAGERFKTAKNALLSQYPMLVLMVGYTMLSLWILAQPITAGG